jgi:hypothetical protein
MEGKMRVLIILFIVFGFTGCESNGKKQVEEKFISLEKEKPHLKLELMEHNPTIRIDPHIPYELLKLKEIWVSLSFDLRISAPSILIPDNVKFLGSSHPDNVELLSNAAVALKKWAYSPHLFEGYKSDQKFIVKFRKINTAQYVLRPHFVEQ